MCIRDSDFADRVAAGGEERLQFTALAPRQAGVVRRPGRDERLATLDPVAEMGDGQGIALGGVVAVDDVEVPEDEKCRPARAGGQEQTGGSVRGDDRLAVGAADATCAPLR